MTIKGMIKAGSLVIALIVIAGALVAGMKINTIRMGGPLQTSNQQMSDLVADILPPPAYVIEPYLEVTLLMQHPEQLQPRKTRLAQLQKDYDARMEVWHQSDVRPEIRTLLTDKAHEHGLEFWRDVNTQILPAIARGDLASAQRAYEKVGRDYAAHRQLIDQTVTAALAEQQSLKKQSETQLAQSVLILSILGAGLALMVAGSAWLLLNQVVRPIKHTAEAMERMAGGDNDVVLEGGHQDNEIGQMVKAVEVFRQAAIAREQAEAEIATARQHQAATVAALGEGLQALASGNLTYRIEQAFPSSYETLRLNFNATMESFGATLRDVADAAESIRTGSSEISTASDDLSRRTEQQAASLEETAAAMDHVSASVRETARSAGDVAHSVKATQGDAQQGGAVVREAVAAMDGIEKSSQEIAHIISVIDGIAFQTNLLALNAGVEAARAGDAGKGFAVVANEVRALAQRSADAAKDIKVLITQSSSQVETGVRLVGQTGEALERIVTRINEISGLVTNIATASDEQATSAQQVNSVVSDMDKMTQQNAAMVEQSTAAARSLADEADKLAELVSQFDLGLAQASRPRRRTTAPMQKTMPMQLKTHGNLAIAPAQEQDWTDF